ncbi:hypothetical protein HanRHA438_Chr17g0822961 [Helianthus annuus]|nr:hypothetical protein HanHA89_Chr17g0714821 [Helianthus annuus]KAJ0817199.1 hypothetical protein HanLR1_Chr00c0463g0752381 [Helianthus annuus]KAJ0827202.1 hypothetical protein HanRHA438_Chr17g0822961 [Helianthus annuus]
MEMKSNLEVRGVGRKFRSEGVSYRDILTSNKFNCLGAGDQQPAGKIERVLEVHAETSAFFAFQEKAVVGRTTDIKSLSALNVLISSAGFPSAKVYYVGGLYVLIVFPEDYEAVEFINNHNVWKDWFSSLDMWEGQSLPYERITWIKFDGVLVHLAENKVFNDLAEAYGKVVHASQLSPDVRNLSVNRVGVLVEHGDLIKDTAILSWKGRKYKVWLSEDQSDWVPECLVEVTRPVPVVGEDEGVQSPLEVHGEMESQVGDVFFPYTRKVADDVPKGINGGKPNDASRLFYSQGHVGGENKVGPESCSQVLKKKNLLTF